MGASAIESIIRARSEGGAFVSVYDFCSRVDLRLNNRKVLESLIKSGAFDIFNARRSQMMAVLENALDAGARGQKEAQVGQFSFFSMDEEHSGFGKNDERPPDIPEWPQAMILSNEKALLGFYLSGHPLDRYKTEIEKFSDFTTASINNARDGQEVRMVGLIKSVKLTTTKKTKERMAIVGLEDNDGEMEVVVFPSSYTQVAAYLKESAVVVVKGKISFRDGFPKMMANEMAGIDEVYDMIKAVQVDLSQANEVVFEKLKEKLSRFPGKIPVYVQVDTHNYKRVQILVSQDLFVTPSEVLMEEIKVLVGETNFSLTL
jgi:DNA polymerase-3 subunit alpha